MPLCVFGRSEHKMVRLTDYCDDGGGRGWEVRRWCWCKEDGCDDALWVGESQDMWISQGCLVGLSSFVCFKRNVAVSPCPLSPI